MNATDTDKGTAIRCYHDCRCSQCSQKLSFDADYAGEWVECPNCGLLTRLHQPPRSDHARVQKALGEILRTARTLRESKLPVNLAAPEFSQPLAELGIAVELPEPLTAA